MTPLPLNENRFSFFVADHLLVCRLCINPKAIGAFYHVWKWHNVQRARSEMHRCTTYALYRSKLWQEDHCQHPQNANPDGSTYQKFPTKVMVFGVVSSEGHIMPLHIFEVGLKFNTKEYLDVLKSVVIPWCSQVAGGRPWVCQQDSAPAHKSKETEAWLQKECYDFVPFSHWPPSLIGPFLPWPEPAGLLRLVIRREHHQHDLPQHQSQSDHRHPPSIRRAPAGACGKGMLPVPDPYGGDDWGWRWLHWIYVSSTT